MSVDCVCAGSIEVCDFFLDKGSDPSHPLRIRLSSKRSSHGGLEYIIEAESPKDFVLWAKVIDAAMRGLTGTPAKLKS